MDSHKSAQTEIKISKFSYHYTRWMFIFLMFSPLLLFILSQWILANEFENGFSKNSEYNIISSTPSPDGKNVAIVYAGWGGGAAGWTFLRATIVPASEQFNSEQNYDYVFDVKGGKDVEIIWEGNDNLLITYTYKPEKKLTRISEFQEKYTADKQALMSDT